MCDREARQEDICSFLPASRPGMVEVLSKVSYLSLWLSNNLERLWCIVQDSVLVDRHCSFCFVESKMKVGAITTTIGKIAALIYFEALT